MHEDLALLMEPVARRLLGEPNKALSHGHDLRFGNRGSLSVDTKKGVWHDHESGEGGGVLALIRREREVSNGEELDWLRGEGFNAPDRNDAPRGTERRSFAKRIERTYDNRDEAGELLFQVMRLRDPKTFRQRRPDPSCRDGWSWKLGDTRRVLYRLPELLEAAEDAIVFVVEGEKDVDRLRSLGLHATTSPEGAGKWRDHYADELTGIRVVAIADNDEPGERHAGAVVASFRNRGIPAAVLHLDGPPPKGDVSDWLDNGGTADPLLARAEEALKAPHDAPPTELPPLGKAEATEDGVARIFTAQYRNTMRFDHDVGRWFWWSGERWQPDRTGRAYEFCREIARAVSEELNPRVRTAVRKASFASGAERMARSDPAHAVTQEMWDCNAFLLGCPDATIDLQTGLARMPNPVDGITKLTAMAPVEQADCPLWLTFLEETTGGDADMIRFLAQWCGYCLTGDTREHALVFIYGPGGNGKSVFLNVLTGILGDYATVASMDTFTASRSDRHPTDLAMLRGARFVTASETEEGRAWAESRIKQLTGGDRISARFMRQDFFTFIPSFKLTIVGNHKPALVNVDDAARRRFKIVPFIHKPAAPDRQLEEKLRAEWPGILRWMIDGVLDWQLNGLVTPKSVAEATTEYFNDQDLFGQWLEEECVAEQENPHRWATSADLFANWTAYAKRAGEESGTAKRFGDNMRRRGFARMSKKLQGKSYKVYLGVQLHERQWRDV